jgi:predicted DNA-binding transcriptional regulator AlpA
MGSSERRRLIGFGRSEGRMTMSDASLSAEEAAKFLGLAISTLAKSRGTGKGPVYCKLGRRVVYRKEDLEAWLESRVVRNTSDADARLPKSLTGEQTNSRLKANPDTAPTRPKQASPGATANTDVRLSKPAIGKNSRSRASATCKS